MVKYVILFLEVDFMFFYDKNNNLVTVSNSILKYFTGMNFNSTCEPLDNILKQK